MIECGDIVWAHGALIKLPDDCVPGIVHYEYEGVKGECYARELRIACMSELFKVAGHPVPYGAVLVYYDGVWTAENDEAYFLFLTVNGTPHQWWSYGSSFRQFNGLPNLSRLPALDAWNILPECLKEMVQRYELTETYDDTPNAD